MRVLLLCLILLGVPTASSWGEPMKRFNSPSLTLVIPRIPGVSTRGRAPTSLRSSSYSRQSQTKRRYANSTPSKVGETDAPILEGLIRLDGFQNIAVDGMGTLFEINANTLLETGGRVPAQSVRQPLNVGKDGRIEASTGVLPSTTDDIGSFNEQVQLAKPRF